MQPLAPIIMKISRQAAKTLSLLALLGAFAPWREFIFLSAQRLLEWQTLIENGAHGLG